MNIDTAYIARRTYVLDASAYAVTPVSVLVIRDNETGEVFLYTVHGGERLVAEKEEFFERWGSTVLMRLEGEHDQATGERSVWVRS